jgi:DnaJ-domain-containing protein 1
MNSDSHTLSEVFSHYIITQQPVGAKETAAEFLRNNDLSRSAFKKVLRELGGSLSLFKQDLLDLLLFYIEFCLRDHKLSPDEKLSIAHLKILFGIKESDLHLLRKEKVKELLEVEVKRLLSDERTNTEEALHQVDLQRIFSLSYDQFLELTRKPIEEIIDEWITRIASDGNVTEEERDSLYRQVLTLDRVYKLTMNQMRTIDNKQPFEVRSKADAKTSDDQQKSRPIIDQKFQVAYTILGVKAGGSAEEIRVAYKRMAQLHHPDKVAQLSPEFREIAEMRMKEINGQCT